ncbi:replicative DNA helicase [Cupriavidus gilardii]|uniref:Replicative DNA helicase n=1 Tax=Cupriavidus gilardii TaxID=82541 RepID=A0ABY4VP47_9BURK|nr:replicative DNA helicase [Cupriavidus gilardii]USE79007.1 replicative DNA helicase [Cupriavidus gilardii]
MNAPMPTPGHDDRLTAVASEQAVLGALLIDSECFDRIGDLQAEHFTVGDHRAIFAELSRQIQAGKPADCITVFERLKAAGQGAADLAYLTELAQNTPGTASVSRHAAIVRERAVRRALLVLGSELAQEAKASGDESPALIDRATSRLEALAQARVRKEPTHVSSSLVEYARILQSRETDGARAISTGFRDIDALLNGGIRPGELIVVAARPKMGKTAFALGLARHAARGRQVLVLSMEMPRAQLDDRNLAAIGHIPLSNLLTPSRMTDDEWNRLSQAMGVLESMGLWLDDQGGLRLLDVRMKAKQVKRRAGLDVLVIDYLQLMEGEGDNRNAQIEGITRGLKALAKELDIAIVLLSQLNRELERRPNKRPQPSDLRDSGAIEQDADVVMFLYRDEVYNPDTTDKGICEVDVALNRQGQPGRVALAYIGAQTRFETLATNWHPAPPKRPPSASRGFE